MPQERRGPVLCLLLDQAKANLARDAAHLENGWVNFGRYVPLAKRGIATQQEDHTQQAKVAQEQAVIKADQAAIEYAKTELAPFDGVAGIRLVDVGNINRQSAM
jgi:membrane fusion protein, multidrug efflux system